MNSETRETFTHKVIRSIPEPVRNGALLKLAEVGNQMIEFYDPNLYLDNFALQSRGKVGVVYAPHRSHADGGVLIEAVRRVNRRNDPKRDFILPIAYSIETRHQGDVIKAFYDAQAKWFGDRHIKIHNTVRDADKVRYGLEGRDRGEQVEFLEGIKPNGGYAFFPEAHVQGGRLNPKTGKRFNMIKVDNSSLQIILNRSRRAGLEVVLIPVGSYGTENIFDNSEGAQEIPINTWVNVLPTIFGVGRKLAIVKPGEPYTLSDMLAAGVPLNNPEAVNEFAMRKFKGLVPDEAMGYYS